MSKVVGFSLSDAAQTKEKNLLLLSLGVSLCDWSYLAPDYLLLEILNFFYKRRAVAYIISSKYG
jgi:hypothetical protein